MENVVFQLDTGEVRVISDTYQNLCYLGTDDTIFTFESSADSKTSGQLTGVVAEHKDPNKQYFGCTKLNKLNKKFSFSNGLNLSSTEKEVSAILTDKMIENGTTHYRNFLGKDGTLHMKVEIHKGKVKSIRLNKENFDI
ncbi:hypothetical protein [Bdellovibrio sp. HCB209]|uniref:hypothetical protein n=1 Tax=Bdellovibrio sp. HCB209 TaxID=3394354 RepID=UPI0039B5B5D3